MGAKRIDCYLDLSSFFSYVALYDLLPNLDKLANHGVQVDFRPVFLGGINHISGNQPPWKLPAKAAYLKFDSLRAAQRVSLPPSRTPENLMVVAQTTSALRALHFIKANYPNDIFLSTLRFLYHKFWTPPNADLTVEANLVAALREATRTPDDVAGPKLFTDADVRRIMDGRAQMKEAVKDETAKVIELGAFGAPWFWVTNAAGEQQPFFGSDRFNHIYRFLDIPHQDVSLVASSKL